MDSILNAPRQEQQKRLKTVVKEDKLQVLEFVGDLVRNADMNGKKQADAAQAIVESEYTPISD